MSAMSRQVLVVLWVVAGLLPPGSRAQQSTEVAGIRFAHTIQLGGGPLQLNGAGVRTKAFFKVYAAGLYLPRKTGSPAEALDMPGAKRIHLVLLRDLPGDEFGKLLASGIEKNATREEYIHSLPGIVRMGESASRYRQLQAGDTLTVDWVPNVGVTLYVKGRQEVGPINDPAFFAAMAKIWLGRAPADATLKEALLGPPDHRGSVAANGPLP